MNHVQSFEISCDLIGLILREILGGYIFLLLLWTPFQYNILRWSDGDCGGREGGGG